MHLCRNKITTQKIIYNRMEIVKNKEMKQKEKEYNNTWYNFLEPFGYDSGSKF